METKSQVHNVEIELTVILGRCTLPMHQLLKMGRGAVIQLRQGADDQVWILANNYPIARGEIAVDGDKVTVIVTEAADVHAFNAAV